MSLSNPFPGTNTFFDRRTVLKDNCKPRKMRVIQIPNRFVKEQWSGTETTILETSRVLNSHGHNSSVFSMKALCERHQEQIRGVDIQRHGFFHPYPGLSLKDRCDMDKKGERLISISTLASLTRAKAVDILHAHNCKGLGSIVRSVAQLRGLPYVISLHGSTLDVPTDERQHNPEPVNGTFECYRMIDSVRGAERVLEDASAIICINQNEQQAVQARYPHKRVEWLPSGVDTDSFSNGYGYDFREKNGIPHNRKIILNVGSIDSRKNQLALLETMPALLRKHNNIHLVLIGPVTVESYGMELLQRVHDASLYDNVSIIPGLPNGCTELINAYQAADIFCLPSRHETIGITVLEAWASGLPVVASRVGSIPSFTQNGVDVLHADPSKPETFTVAIDRLLRDSNFASRLAARGRFKARTDYDWRQVTNRLEDLYSDLLRT